MAHDQKATGPLSTYMQNLLKHTARICKICVEKQGKNVCVLRVPLAKKQSMLVLAEAIRREILRVLCEFSSMLFTVTATALSLEISILQIHATS
jgi:hypothetical protein